MAFIEFRPVFEAICQMLTCATGREPDVVLGKPDRRMLEGVMRRHGLTPPARLESAGTVIDFTARRLATDGVEVPLTAREWSVLELLAGRPGRVVSRDELLEALWGELSPEASASLDVIMSRLRRKLGDAPERCRVSTVRGEGYRFEAHP